MKFPSQVGDNPPEDGYERAPLNRSIDASTVNAAEQLQSTGQAKINRKEIEFQRLQVAIASQGKFYPKSSPCYGLRAIEVRSLVAPDNDILYSQKLLKKGKMFDELIRATILTDSVAPEDLLPTDKTAILIALRINGMGDNYNPKTKHSCPYCNGKFAYTFDLSQLGLKKPDPLIEKADPRDDGTFDYTTSRGNVLTLKYLTGAEEDSIDQEVEASRKLYKNKDVNQAFSIRLKHQIVAIDGKKERGFIRDFIESGKLTMKDTTDMRLFLSSNMPEVDLNQEITCPECGAEFLTDIEITREFFFPTI